MVHVPTPRQPLQCAAKRLIRLHAADRTSNSMAEKRQMQRQRLAFTWLKKGIPFKTRGQRAVTKTPRGYLKTSECQTHSLISTVRVCVAFGVSRSGQKMCRGCRTAQQDRAEIGVYKETDPDFVSDIE